MLIAARQDGETVQQQVQGEIQELKLRCRSLEEQLSASDREQDRLHQDNMRLLTAKALSQPSSSLLTKRADTAAAAPADGNAQQDSTAKQEEPYQEEPSPEAAAAPSLPTQRADTAAAAPEDGTAKDCNEIEAEPFREVPSPQAVTAPSLGLAPFSRPSPPTLHSANFEHGQSAPALARASRMAAVVAENRLWAQKAGDPTLDVKVVTYPTRRFA